MAGSHHTAPHGLRQAIADVFRAFPVCVPVHTPSNCLMLTTGSAPQPRAGPPPALQPPQGAGEGPWHRQMGHRSRLLFRGWSGVMVQVCWP